MCVCESLCVSERKGFLFFLCNSTCESVWSFLLSVKSLISQVDGQGDFLWTMFCFSALKPEIPSVDKKPNPIRTEDRGTVGLSSLFIPSHPSSPSHLIFSLSYVHSFNLFHVFCTFLSRFGTLRNTYTVVLVTTNSTVDLGRE